MRKARFTEHESIAVLTSIDAGRTVKDDRSLRDQKDESRRLKHMFTDLSLECRALKDIIEKL